MVIGWCGAVCAGMRSAAGTVRGESCVVRGRRAGIAAGGREGVTTGIGVWGGATARNHVVGGDPIKVFLAHHRLLVIKGTRLRVFKVSV